MDTGQRLRYAVVHDKLAPAKLILEKRPDLLVNINSANGWSNLHYAAYHGNYAMCVYLVGLGHDRDEISLSHSKDTPVHLAAAQNEEKTLHYLTQHFSRAIDWRNLDQRTPLMVAVTLGNDPCVNILIDFGANIERGETGGTRPLHIAAARGHIKIIRTLLDRGADAHAKNDKGWTPVDYACTFQVQKYLKAILQEQRKPAIGYSAAPSTPVHGSFSIPEFS